jgi:hypothetical protein
VPDGDIGDLADDVSIVDDEQDDGDVADPTAQTAVSRSRRRLESSIATWTSRATAAEAELATVRAEAASLEAQLGNVSQLRTSLLETVIRAQAAPLVRAEALDDTVRLVDLSSLKIADDGTIDLADVKSTVEDFVKARPYLAKRAGNGQTARALPGGHGMIAPTPQPHSEINDLLRRRLRDH